MNIADFKSRLGQGGARPNQFRVLLAFPTLAAAGLKSDYSVLVSGAAIPASTVNPAIVQYRGREVKLAGERIFDPWTITIINDTNQSLRGPFDKVDNGAEALTPSEYQVDLTVEHLDRNDDPLPLGTYLLHDAFPINMSEIALQYAQNDVIEEFTVTFQYQHYSNT